MDEEPKFGLMVSLVLMNLTAVALFFFATPTQKKQNAEDPQHIHPKQVEMVMAGDAETRIMDDEAVLPMMTNEAELGSIPALKKNMGGLDVRNPLYSTHGQDTVSQVQVFMPTLGTSDRTSQQVRVSTGNAEPPLAIAMRKFVSHSKSGMIRLFKGLKNGYMEKRIGPECRISDAKLENNLPIEPSPEHDSQESWIWGPWDNGSSANQETTISTDIVMDVLSKTQKRTAELIEVFSNKVVPAIERMNDKVAEAVRLEKNLDSYTSTLISAIDSVVCPKDEKDPMNRPGKSPAKKSKLTKPQTPPRSDLSLVRDSRIRDYARSLTKGKPSKLSGPSKRPVFKTLTARCLHKRRKKIFIKTKRHEERSEQPVEPLRFGGQTLHPEFGPFGIVPVQDAYSRAPANHSISQGLSKLEESPLERTIFIEDVLALTSSLEQSYDHDICSDMDFKSVQSDFSSGFFMSSGMRIRSPYITETPNHGNTSGQAEEQFPGAALISLRTTNEFPESTAARRPELAEHSVELAQQPSGTLTSDCSVVCDSRVQCYDSFLARKESSTIAQHYFGNDPRTTDLKSALPESKHSASGNMKNTNDLVKIFKRLDLQEKKIALDNVCLLVLRIFEAWSESQQPISPLGISKISLSSWSSKDQGLSNDRRRTTILRSKGVGSVQERQAIMDDSFSRNGTSKHSLPDEQSPNIPTLLNCSALTTEISRSLVQCAVEAAEIQIAERSLKDLKTNFRTSQMKGDKVYVDSREDGNPSGFGDMKDSITASENQNVPLASKSLDSIAGASKESSSSTFYTDQPESSEDAFYECISTISTGTYSLNLEDSSKLFLESIQEEDTKQREKCPEEKAVINPQSSFSIESWLSESAEELRITKEDIPSYELSDSSSVYVVCGTDDETYPCNSLDSTDEFGADVSQREKQKKKKWGARLLKKFRKKKTKPSPIPIATSNTSVPQSDSAVLKLDDPIPAKNIDELGQ